MDESKKDCRCSSSNEIEKESVITMKIKWKRLISKGETCLRCGSTEEELGRAISNLKQSLAPLRIEVILEKEELSVT